MKTTATTLLVSSAILLSACVPEAPLPSPPSAPQEPDRYDANHYTVDEENNADLQGLWIMTTKDYEDSIATQSSRNSDTSHSITQGSFRMACAITLVEGNYESSCYGTGPLGLVEGELANEDGSWSATVVDNTHINGAYYVHATQRNNFNGITTTYITSFDFEMVKVGSVGDIIGSMTLTSNGQTESSEVNEFYETVLEEVRSVNGVIVSTEAQAMFNAFGNPGNLFGSYDALNGTVIQANTASLSVYSNSASLDTSVNNLHELSATVNGTDSNNAEFSGTLDISL
jgi:hypothetical protein